MEWKVSQVRQGNAFGMSSELDKNYSSILQSLKEKIRQARLRASVVVNAQLLQVYWEIGQTILEQQDNKGWGAKIIDKFASDLKIEFEDMKGLSPRNLRYMRGFAKAYPDFTILKSPIAELPASQDEGSPKVQQPAAQLQSPDSQSVVIWQHAAAKLPWGHHQVILDRLKEKEERIFYIRHCVLYGWSRDVLIHQIESSLYRRQGALTNNFKQTMPDYKGELAQQLFKDPYNLDFIALGMAAKERDLENAFINHILKVLLELGDGFAFMGRQYRLEAGDQEYFLDLLFYHTKLRRHVVIDLKIGDFVPEYAGKMNFYLGIADDRLKGHQDEPSIGLILCKTKNKIIAEYALRDTGKPIGIAEYRINEILPDDIKGELPTIEEIEKKLEKGLETPIKRLDAKLTRIQELASKMKGRSLQEKDSKGIIELFTQILPKLIVQLEIRLESIIREFKNHTISRILNDQHRYMTDVDLDAQLLKDGVHRLGILVDLQGFIRAGTKTFNVWKELKFELRPFHYDIKTFANQDVILQERLYDQPWAETDIEIITEQFAEHIADDIVQNIEGIQSQLPREA
jgi:predicted nuclease of restriction endonuclease-like (RecB) superfamily